MTITNAGTVWLNGSGHITHVINGLGGIVDSTYTDKISAIGMYP